jgi:hypothetical protein
MTADWKDRYRGVGPSASSNVISFPGRRRPRVLPFLIGLGLAGTSLGMNLTYAAGQGASLADRLSLGSGALLIEALAIVFPSLALDLWRARHRTASGLCTAIAAGAITLATWSNLDYIRQTSGDHTAARAAVADQRSDLRARIDIASRERAAITEPRSIAELSAALARLRIAPWALNETARCTREGSPPAERLCAPHRRLAEARAAATHRDELDSALARYTESLRALPATAPIAPSALRLILFALVPGALAGPVLMLARW